MINEVTVDLNMFNTFMEYIIVSNLDDTSTVVVDRNFSRTINA